MCNFAAAKPITYMKRSFTLLFCLCTLWAGAKVKIATVEIQGESVMTFGADPDTPFSNPYAMVLRDDAGNVVDGSALGETFSVVWDIDGFRTDNDTEGQYCDSYGCFSVNGKAQLATTFELRNVPFNFVGQMSATLTVGRQTLRATKYVAALGFQAPSATAADCKGQTLSVAAESGRIYRVRVAYTGALMASYLNADLAGYELGRQQQADTVEYDVPCVGGVIDLHAIAADGAEGRIDFVGIEPLQPRQRRAKQHVHHIGDSTAANRGSWASRLLALLSEGRYAELAALCDFCNDGAGGRNLATYYAQGRLSKVLLDLCPGDVVVLGNNGTNGMNQTFEEDLNLYVSAVEAFGAKVAFNSYTPHGAVSRWTKGYDAATQRFDSYRRDTYDEVLRRVAGQRMAADTACIGFIEIGKRADEIFNAYVDDYQKNGYDSRDAAAQAIIACFTDHNHYSAAPLACDLMLNGYNGLAGIVEQMVKMLKEQ